MYMCIVQVNVYVGICNTEIQPCGVCGGAGGAGSAYGKYRNCFTCPGAELSAYYNNSGTAWSAWWAYA